MPDGGKKGITDWRANLNREYLHFNYYNMKVHLNKSEQSQLKRIFFFNTIMWGLLKRRSMLSAINLQQLTPFSLFTWVLGQN